MKPILSILILSLCFSCKLPSLGINQEPLESGILKTHGFYFNKHNYWYFLLYNNGVISGDVGVSEKTIQSVIKNIQEDTTYRVQNQKTPYFWGLYAVKGDSIYISHWESRSWAAYGVTKYDGKILNDSTLLLRHFTGLDTFYFHFLERKPDSLNKFFK